LNSGAIDTILRVWSHAGDWELFVSIAENGSRLAERRWIYNASSFVERAKKGLSWFS